MQDRELERVKQDIKKLEERLPADRQRIRQKTEALNDQVQHMPIQLGTVTDRKAQMEMLSKTRDIQAVRNQTAINRWNDGYGNNIYLRPNVLSNQVPAVAARIAQQREAFKVLEPGQQTQVRTAFGSAKPDARTRPYQDFLQSESLGRRFQELTPSSPTPR